MAYPRQSSTRSSRKARTGGSDCCKICGPTGSHFTATLCELAHDGKVVYHGHLGHELLSGIGHVLKVLLTAPIEISHRTNSNAAKSDGRCGGAHYIEEVDKARQSPAHGDVRHGLA